MPQRGPATTWPAALSGDIDGRHLGAGVEDGLSSGDGHRARRLSQQGFLIVACVVPTPAPHPEGGAHAGQECRRRSGVSGRRGMEAVLAEHLPGRGCELRPEQVPERDGASAGLDDGDGLSGGEVATPSASQAAQGLRQRLDGAQVGARAHHHLGPQIPSVAHHALQRAHGDGSVDPVRDVIGPDEDEDDVGGGDDLDRCGELTLQIRALGPDHRSVGELDATPEQCGDARGHDGPNGLLPGVCAQPGGRRIT